MRHAIRTHPDPILYQVAKPVPEELFGTPELDRIVADIRETMQGLADAGDPARGLAAPQIGYSFRVFVLALYPHAFCNPELECVPGKEWIELEECFSVPAVAPGQSRPAFPVWRARKIKLRYRLPSGEKRATKMRDKDARVAQHEYDHLDGQTIITRGEKPEYDVALR